MLNIVRHWSPLRCLCCCLHTHSYLLIFSWFYLFWFFSKKVHVSMFLGTSDWEIIVLLSGVMTAWFFGFHVALDSSYCLVCILKEWGLIPVFPNWLWKVLQQCCFPEILGTQWEASGRLDRCLVIRTMNGIYICRAGPGVWIQWIGRTDGFYRLDLVATMLNCCPETGM